MKFVMSVLIIVHLLSWALVLGGNVATLRERKVYGGSLHAAFGALVTGIVMYVLVMTPLVAWSPNHMKLGIKSLVALVVVGLAYLAQKSAKENKSNGSLVIPIIAATAINVIIAVAW